MSMNRTRALPLGVCEVRQDGEDKNQCSGHCGHDLEAAHAATAFAVLQRVEAHPEHPGKELQAGVRPAITKPSGVSREGFLLFQRRREAFLLTTTIGLAIYDERQDAFPATHCGERLHLPVHPHGRGRIGRTDHDQIARGDQCILDGVTQIG